MKKILLATISVAFISALNAQSFEWGGAFGGVGEDVVRAMAVDDEGNIYTTGYFTDTSDLDPTENTDNRESNGFFDIFIQKVNTEGNLVWARTFGGTFFDYGTGVEADDDGNVYITGVFQETVDFDPGEGTFELTSNGSEDIFALKLDSDGDFVWAVGMGSPFYEEPVSVGVDGLGNVYVGGYFSNTIDFDPGEGVTNINTNGGQDIFVVKLDQDGNFLLAGGLGGPEQDLCLGMDVSSGGDVYLTGAFNETADFDPGPGEQLRTSLGNFDGFITKLNALGEHSYTVTFGGTDSDIAWDVALDAQGNAYAAGGFRGQFQSGFDVPPDAVGSEDVFVVKVNPFGAIEWARALQGDDFQQAYDVNTDPFGNGVIAGYFANEMDFDPGEGEEIVTAISTEPFDGFVSVLSSNGEYVYGGGFGGSNFVEHHGVDTDSEGNIYLSAGFQNTVDLDPSEGESNVSSVAFRDSYIIKLAAGTVSTENSELPEIKVFPNPATDFITAEGISQAPYTILDVTGKVVSQGILNSQRIDVSDLNEGLYILNIRGFQPTKVVVR